MSYKPKITFSLRTLLIFTAFVALLVPACMFFFHREPRPDSPFTNAAPLKDVPYPPDGSFAWLRGVPKHDEWALGERCADSLPAQLESITSSAADVSLALPDVFTAFMGDATLHQHLRSANGDYLNLAESVLPFADGYLIRFLHDQQEAVF